MDRGNSPVWGGGGRNPTLHQCCNLHQRLHKKFRNLFGAEQASHCVSFFPSRVENFQCTSWPLNKTLSWCYDTLINHFIEIPNKENEIHYHRLVEALTFPHSKIANCYDLVREFAGTVFMEGSGRALRP